MPKTLKPSKLIVTFMVMGFSAMISQVVIIRELLIFFTGNELTLGIILALWLLWTAVGSGFVGKLSAHVKQPVTLLIILFIKLVVILPATIVFIRLSRIIFSIPVGEVSSPLFIVLIPLLSLAPICIIVGFLYTLSCKVLSQSDSQTSKVPGKVFLYEAVGAGVAGFVASIVLFRYLENFQIVLLISIINLSTAFMLRNAIKPKRTLISTPIFLVSVVLVSILFPSMDRLSSEKSWGIFQLLSSKTTIYGNIAVTRLGESISFYENGMLMFTHPDRMYAEETVHFALLSHPKPEKILLIGGDAAANLPQIFYHPTVKQVDFVLLDPQAIRLARQFIPSLSQILQDDRVHVWYEDGRIFLNKTSSKYDVIIINLPEPQTTMINRFYTVEFYKIARSKLKQNGMLSFSCSSSENVIGDEQAEFLSTLYRTFHQVFEDIILIPGYSIHFIGCASKDVLPQKAEVFIERINRRQLPTVFVRDYYIRFRLSEDRMNYLKEKITTGEHGFINRDFYPVGYFFNSYLWVTHFNKRLIGTIDGLIRSGKYFITTAIVAIILLFLSVFVFSKGRKAFIRKTVLLSMAVIGCTAISLEVLIIYGFQAIYGYAYFQLALIITGFMIGLMVGSWYGLFSIRRTNSLFNRFIFFQGCIAIYPVIVVGVLYLLSKTVLPAMIIQLVFLLLIGGIGFLSGHQFPLANHVLFQIGGQIERIGGTLYAWDLLGSVIGALLISSILIPTLGMLNTSIVFLGVNLFAFIFLMLNRAALGTVK